MMGMVGGTSYKRELNGDIPRDVTHVKVHPSVKAIKDRAFSSCSQLKIVNFGERLEEIGLYPADRYVRS
jgi:hypothetical protein